MPIIRHIGHYELLSRLLKSDAADAIGHFYVSMPRDMMK